MLYQKRNYSDSEVKHMSVNTIQQGNNLPVLFTTDVVLDPLENIPGELQHICLLWT